MLLLRIKGTRKTIIQSKGASQAKTEGSPMLLTSDELVRCNRCGRMKCLGPNKTLLFIFLCVTVSCQQRTSYINHSLYIPIRKPCCSPCFCAFLIHLFEKLLLSSIPCHSSGMKWMILLPFAVVPVPFEEWAPGSWAVLRKALLPALAIFTWRWQVHPSNRM